MLDSRHVRPLWDARRARILRHANDGMTLKHFRVLGLPDTAAAIERLPTIQSDEHELIRATGTDHTTPDSDPQQHAQQLERGRVRNGAEPCTLRLKRPSATSVSTWP